MVTARATNQRVEDLSQRDVFTRVYANPDGTWTSETASEPEQAKDAAGEWQDIDTTLIHADGGLRATAAASDVLLSDGGDKTFAQITEDGHDLDWRWNTNLPVPEISGSTATYKNVVPNGDLVVTATSTGFTHSIVLNAPPADDVDYVMPLATHGAPVEETVDGGITVETKAGDTLVEAPAPLMWDSSQNSTGDPEVQPVDTAVGTTAGGTPTVTLSPDQDFLTDPATVYPVTIDPSFTTYTTGDTWVQTPDYTNSQFNSDTLRVGTYDSGTHKARSFVHFDTNAWNGKNILSASLVMRNYDSASCASSAIRVSRITEAWTAGTVTWANQPAAGSSYYDDYAPAKGYNSSCDAGDATWNLKDMVQDWASGNFTNNGVRIKAVDETTNASWRKYRSANYDSYTYLRPKMNVTYNSYPNTAWTPSISTSPASSTGYSTSTTPTFKSTVTDPDGGNVRADFEVLLNGVSKWTGNSTYVTSGSPATKAITSGILVNGNTYTLRAKADDGTDVSKSWNTTTFTVDTSAPATTLTSTGFSNNQWASTPPGSNTFTFDGPADTKSFTYTQDGVDGPPKTADANGNATLTWLPSNGAHTLIVTAVDKAGNTGTPSTFNFGVGAAALDTPVADQASTAVFAVTGNGPANATGATVEYRIADTGASWSTATNVKTSTGSAWSGAVTQVNGLSTVAGLSWDARAAAAVTGSMTIELRLCFTYPSSTNCSAGRNLQLVESAFGGLFPTTQVGPAQVALHTGEAMIGTADAADATVGFGRTFSSFNGATTTDGPLGYGWSSNMLSALSTDAGASVVDNHTSQKRFVLRLPGWGEQTYSQVGSSSVYAPEGVDDGTRLVLNSAGDELTYSPVGGSTVTWTLSAGEWALDSLDPTGTGSTSINESGNVTFIAQVAPGTGAACNLTQQQDGCRGLKISSSGGHVTQVDQVIAGKADRTVATYAYSSGTLTSVCDPSQATDWCTNYTYVTVAGRTLLASVSPPGGLKTWRFEYDASGRLTTVNRALDAATGTGDAVWTVKYNIDLAATGLPSITATSAADWGQTTIPTRAAAVWQPNRTPASTPSSSDYSFAQVYWSTTDGRTTNTAVNSGSQWLVDTTWYDDHLNAVRQLDGAGWARVQTAAAADRPGLSYAASSFTRYSPEGDRVEDAYGAIHTTTLTDGTVGSFRTHSAFAYDDEVSGLTVPSPPNGQTSWNLVVDTTTSAATADMTDDYDQSLVRTTYDKIVSTDGSGWDLGIPTRTMTQLAGGGWSTKVDRYNTDGQVIESRQPGGSADSSGAGNDAHSTVYVYYTAGTNAADSSCGNHPEWSGLQCRVGPAAQPSGQTIPTTYTTSYSRDLSALITEEHSGSTVRTKTLTLDSRGRTATTSIAITSGNASDPSMADVSYTYDPVTGQTATITAGSKVISQSYDSWGRPKTYVDAAGTSSTSTYTPASEIATQTDGLGTYTYTYGDHRGLISSVDVGLSAGPDTFDLSYDDQGNTIAFTYPNGTTATRTFDELGVPKSLDYSNSGAEIVGFSTTTDVNGRTTASSSAASTQAFTYDRLGRLTQVEDTRAGACTTRTYGFSAASERTAKSVFPAAALTGGCQATQDGSTWTGSYDSANRLTNAGYTYDTLGRSRTAPAIDTPSNSTGDLTAAYYPNDTVANLTQTVADGAGGSVSMLEEFSIDGAGRVDGIITTAGASETTRLRNQFSNASDSPTSIATSADAGAHWTTTRYLQVPGLGMVGAVTGSGGASWQLTNMHGDVVASQANTVGNATLDSYSETDEYGVPLGSVERNYGYLGAYQRYSGSVGGLTVMGARAYNPRTGSFLSMDAVQGGGATRFAYPTNPMDTLDLSGEMWGWVFKLGMKAVNIGFTGLCGGTVTFFFICRAVISGAISSLTYIGWQKYVVHDPWYWSTAVAYFIVGAIGSLPGSSLAAVSQAAFFALKYWVGKLLSFAYSKFSAIGWMSIAGIIWSLRDSVNRSFDDIRR